MLPLNEAKWFFRIKKYYCSGDPEGACYLWEVCRISGDVGVCDDIDTELYSKHCKNSKTEAEDDLKEFVKVNNIKNYTIREDT